MKLKQLESLLGDLQQFSDPKVDLEQYPTGPHIASRMLYTAENSFGDVTDKVVADFGCGCGTLGAAASLMGAQQVIGIDVDPQSLEIASLNAEDLELDIDFILCDIRNLTWRGHGIDTVVMNPPFGTRKKGADMDFLFAALKIASQAVYSLHKTSTRDLAASLGFWHRVACLQLPKYEVVAEILCLVIPHFAFDHVRRAALRDFGASSAEVLCELRFDVPQLYKFHKRREVDVAVDLWRFTAKHNQGNGM